MPKCSRPIRLQDSLIINISGRTGSIFDIFDFLHGDIFQVVYESSTRSHTQTCLDSTQVDVVPQFNIQTSELSMQKFSTLMKLQES